jgi:deazaflavin-dependent oxidoreductase (nitroreductase family)
MSLLTRVIKFAQSDAGRSVDIFAVRWSGISLINILFSRLTKSSYNKALLLTTIGSKTGLKRTVVLPYFLIDDKVVVVGSRGGMPTDPMWARNIRTNPQVWIRIKRKLRESTPYLVEGDERESLWTTICREEKVYIAYQEKAKAHRQLPVFVLTTLPAGKHSRGLT